MVYLAYVTRFKGANTHKLLYLLKISLEVSIRDYDGHLNDFVNNTRRRGLRKLWEDSKFVNFTESYKSIDEVVTGKRIYIDSRAALTFIGRLLNIHIINECEYSNVIYSCIKIKICVALKV